MCIRLLYNSINLISVLLPTYAVSIFFLNMQIYNICNTLCSYLDISLAVLAVHNSVYAVSILIALAH